MIIKPYGILFRALSPRTNFILRFVLLFVWMSLGILFGVTLIVNRVSLLSWEWVAVLFGLTAGPFYIAFREDSKSYHFN